MTAGPPWSVRDGGVELRVRVTPKGGRDAIDGVETRADGRCVLKLRVRAAPTDGEANDAVVRLIAKAIGVGQSQVGLISGASAREKTLRLEGAPTEIVTSLQKIATGKILSKTKDKA